MVLSAGFMPSTSLPPSVTHLHCVTARDMTASAQNIPTGVLKPKTWESPEKPPTHTQRLSGLASSRLQVHLSLGGDF